MKCLEKIGRCCCLLLCCVATSAQTPSRVVTGAERMDLYLPILQGKQVALVVNHSSRVGHTHLVDSLLARGVQVTQVFAPEHGFRGLADAGEEVVDGCDVRSDLPVTSLYGKKKKPAPADLADANLVIFDIQDVGTRFYTYISTLYYVLEACAENGKQVLVLDRPNPNGHFVDGPLLEQGQESFVGVAPIPIVHGCTVGELARLFTGERFFKQADKLNLQVIPCANYNHATPYTLPVRPSPNLPDMRSVLLYPSLCLFEGTTVSVGRGTDQPFQVVGHPDFPMQDFVFTPCQSSIARFPPQEGRLCRGYDLSRIDPDSLYRMARIDLHWMLDFYCELPDKAHFFLKNHFFDLLAGTPQLRLQIEQGTSEEEIRASWADGLAFFRLVRRGYLLYPD